MYIVKNITNDSNQSFNLIIPGQTDTVGMTLIYQPRLMCWEMGIAYKNVSISNFRVCSIPNLLRQWFKILPFGLGCYTTDNTDPFYVDDFQSGRCGLLMLSQSDVLNLEAYLLTQKEALL